MNQKIAAAQKQKSEDIRLKGCIKKSKVKIMDIKKIWYQPCNQEKRKLKYKKND